MDVSLVSARTKLEFAPTGVFGESHMQAANGQVNGQVSKGRRVGLHRVSCTTEVPEFVFSADLLGKFPVQLWACLSMNTPTMVA